MRHRGPPASASLTLGLQAHIAMPGSLCGCWKSEVNSELLEWQALYRLSYLRSPRINIFFFCLNFKLSLWEPIRTCIVLLWDEVFEEVVSICLALVCWQVSSRGWTGEVGALPTEQDLIYLFSQKEAVVFARLDLGEQQICKAWKSQLKSFASGWFQDPCLSIGPPLR